jgi:hypothetical protein
MVREQIKAQYEAIAQYIHDSNSALDSKLETRDNAYKYVTLSCYSLFAPTDILCYFSV